MSGEIVIDAAEGATRNDMYKEIPLIEIRNLRVHYEMNEGVVEAVNGLDLTIYKGETFGLIGETGAGKTTTALSILGLLPEPRAHVIHGAILLDGENLFEKSRKEMLEIRGNKISMIFQDPMTALNPVHKIGKQVTEVIALHQNTKDRKRAELDAVDMLRVVGIQEDRFENYPFEFSGGMKQRVVIAMALACRPELIIADEPTTALDVTIQAQVLAMMKERRETYNTSVLMITHDFGVVAETCDRCAVMYAGEVVEQGTIEHIFDDPRHPYTIGLFNALPSLDKNKQLKPIKGLMPDPMNLPSHCTFADRCDRCADMCSRDDPQLTEVSPGHLVKCFLAVGLEAE